jgi:amino acid transporter
MSYSRPDIVAQALARDRLGVLSVVFFVMSAAAPLTVAAGVVPTGYAVTGITGIPVAFLAIAVILLVFSVGYVEMAKQIANAGAFYAYIARGLGPPLGVGGAWVALLAYNALQVGLYGALGAIAAPLFEGWFNREIAWWVIALAAWALVAVLGLMAVDVNGKVLAVLLVAEVIAILVFSGANVLDPATGSLSFAGLSPTNLTGPDVGALLALAFLGFVGFEQAVVFSEESRDPQRTVRVATFVAVVLIAGLYCFSSWAIAQGTGPDNVVARARAEGPELLFNTAAARLGESAVHIGHALFLTSLVAAMISFHNTTARYAFALGREGVLPRSLGRTSRRTNAPVVGSLIQTAFGLAVIGIYAFFNLDPLVQLFFWGGTGGGLGILILIVFTALAIIVYFLRNPEQASVWRRLIAPVLAALALVAVLIVAIANFDTLLGVKADDWIRWAIPGAFAVIALLGVAWGLVLAAIRPSVYSKIGLGARAEAVVDRGAGHRADDAMRLPR